jgi:hypothetical protein
VAGGPWDPAQPCSQLSNISQPSVISSRLRGLSGRVARIEPLLPALRLPAAGSTVLRFVTANAAKTREAHAMRSLLPTFSLGLALLAGAAGAQTAANGADPRDQAFDYDKALACSKQLAAGNKLPVEQHRACLILISSTYIEFEQSTLAPEKMLLADDISRHPLGSPPDYKPGAHMAVRNATSQKVITAIRNRQWVADGSYAWITYDGFRGGDKPSFWVSERFLIEKGVIKEILIPAPKVSDPPKQ